jgi:hypothetical protein
MKIGINSYFLALIFDKKDNNFFFMKFLKICTFLVFTPSFVYGDVWPITKVVIKDIDPNDTSGHEKQNHQDMLAARNDHDKNEKIQESLNKGDNTGQSNK